MSMRRSKIIWYEGEITMSYEYIGAPDTPCMEYQGLVRGSLQVSYTSDCGSQS